MKENQPMGEFVYRFVKWGAFTGLLLGAAYPVLILSGFQYSDQADTIFKDDRLLLVIVAAAIAVTSVLGLMMGSLVGWLNGLAGVSLIRQYSHSHRNDMEYKTALGLVSGLLTVCLAALLFGFYPLIMQVSPLFAIPGSVLAAIAAVIASQRIAAWYLSAKA